MAAIPRFFLSAAMQPRRLFFLFTHRRFLSAASSSRPPAPGAADPSSLSSSFGLRTTLVMPKPQSPHLLLRFSSVPNNTNSTASFDWSDDDDDDASGHKNKKVATKEIDKSKLPPPYDPFSKKPVIEEPEDPKDLQEIFHRMRSEGLTNHAIKMFDALSKDGLTHEALALFSQIKDKGNMPEVVAHTAVIEAYANAGGHSKETIRTYDRMLASGVTPNAYTYAVLVKGLARDGKLKEASKYVMEMMGKGMRPNVGTYVALFEAYVKEQKAEEVEQLLEEMKGKGFVPDEKAVREHLSKRGPVFRSVMSLLFGK